ncbi:PhnE/PtxC family ABC transporter permease [Cohnella thailandensis]|uniref:ABC transporter permease subunit n=1 Tax=Cohnella thailandensis TaxID=557557 RepID=A0A841SS89_9BACL|nr:ABC transporter permease subunit [Cohnella thailandensis]MBB6633068.1 ABC transporter permease subunit [Cohnella thailandensis]MBP1975237.1 phosphonate transport system permease protein [Cohnella thailandensis]
MKIPISHKATKRNQRLFFLVMIVLFVPCLFYLNLSATQFAEGIARIPDIAKQFLQISLDDLPKLLTELLTSVIIAFLSVVISVIVALLLSFVIADTTAPNRHVAKVLRVIVVVIRTIPTTIWVLLAVASMGFGSMAGVLGLLFPTTSFLIKSFTAQIDEAGKDSVEAIRALGGTWWHVVCNGAIPTLYTTFLALIAFNFEMTVAETVILGMVGAGGIGVLLQEYISYYEFAPLLMGILVVFITLFLLEMMTNQIRKRLNSQAR